MTFQKNDPTPVNNSGNEVLDGDGFYISYQPDTAAGPFGAFFSGNGETLDETALVKDGKFFILNGDWREQYAELVPNGWDACKSFFDKHADEHKSVWSN